MGKHSLKTNNYSNVLMQAPDGTPMFRCGQKKLNWYLSRNLAEIISEEDEVIARFLFEPKGFGWSYDDYFLAIKKNHCVVCGSEKHLTRHHVIPYCYRRYFPDDIKSHNSYDIVLLCVDHHDEYEDHAHELKKKLATKHRAPLNGIGGSTDTNLSRANAYRMTLLGKHNIPSNRQDDMLSFILDVYNQVHGTKRQQLSVDDLTGIENFDCSTRPHTQHGEVIIKHYDPDNLAIMWRRHFVDYMSPKNLPSYWCTDRRIYEEARAKMVAKDRDWDSINTD